MILSNNSIGSQFQGSSRPPSNQNPIELLRLYFWYTSIQKRLNMVSRHQENQ